MVAIQRIVIEGPDTVQEVDAVSHRTVTAEEKAHIIDTLMACPVGSKKRSLAMDKLQAELLAKPNPPTLSKSFRNLWSQWCSSRAQHTKAKPSGVNKRGRPRGVIRDDAIELLDDMHTRMRGAGWMHLTRKLFCRGARQIIETD